MGQKRVDYSPLVVLEGWQNTTNHIQKKPTGASSRIVVTLNICGKAWHSVGKEHAVRICESVWTSVRESGVIRGPQLDLYLFFTFLSLYNK